MGDEVWILGATGRVGRAIAARLSGAGIPLVLHGRDRMRTDALVAGIATARPFIGSLDAATAKIKSERPAVVVNTIGPFVDSAERVARACPPGTHYVDMGNEFAAAEAVLGLDEFARSRQQTFVTSAGFGVYSTEAALLHALEKGESPQQVRVDSLASVANDGGVVGEVLARTIVESFAFGGRVVRDGRLRRTGIGTDPERFETPDGDAVSTSSWASTDLLAAWRASDAAEVVAASRRMLPALTALLRIRAVASLVTRTMAGVTAKAQPAPRAHSWARARVRWSDGRTTQSWLRTGEAMIFTVAVTSEVARRLARGEGRPGAFTPGGLFGRALVSDVGADLVRAGDGGLRGIQAVGRAADPD